MRKVWTLNDQPMKKRTYWGITLVVLGGFGLGIFLKEARIFDWELNYFYVPLVFAFIALTFVTEITERRKNVRIYFLRRHYVFVPDTSPRTLGRELRSWFPYVLVAIVIGTWSQDETLDQGFKKFYLDGSHEVPDGENVAVALSGLDAPAESSFVEAGRAEYHVSRNRTYSGRSEQPEVNHAKPKTNFVGKSEELYCWISIPGSNESCASEQRINDLLQSNAMLLSRYRQVSRLPHFQGLAANWNPVIDLNRLIAADVELKLRHREYEAAYIEWRDNYQFITRMLGEDTDWVAKAIFTVLDGISLGSARSLLQTYPGIAALHGDELTNLFRTAGLSRWNLPGVMRSEYLMFEPILSPDYRAFWVHPNFIRNRFFLSSQAFLIATTAQPDQIEEKSLAVRREYGDFRVWTDDYLRDPPNTFFARVYILPTMLTAGAMVRTMHVHDGQRKVLTLALLANRRGLRDQEIGTFLSNVGSELKNPISGAPMRWNIKKQAIEFADQKNNFVFDVKLSHEL